MLKCMYTNKKGMSLVEIMIAVALLGIFTTVSYRGVSLWKKDLSTLKRTVTSEDIIANIRKSLATKGAILQVDYTETSAVKLLSDANNLTMAWSTSGDVLSVAKCGEKCPAGRYGFVVKPVAGARGLYHMTIKVTHAKWKEDKFYNVLVGD